MTGVLAAARFVHLAALALLLGSFVFLVFVARPAFAGRHVSGTDGEDPETEFRVLDRMLLRMAAWSLVIAALAAVVWLVTQAVLLTGVVSASSVLRVFTRTQFGRLWQFRLGTMVLSALLLIFREREQDGRDWLALRLELLGLAGLLVATMAWAGHAAATEPAWRAGHLTADVIHLVATAIWLGGLPALALLLARTRWPATPGAQVTATVATRRFSALALACVAALTVTGVVNTAILSGDVPSLVGTPYGRWLLLKLAIFGVVVGIAAVNRFRLKPQLITASQGIGPLLGRLRANVTGEACGGALILLVVGILGITPPGRHVQPVWPFSFRLDPAAAAQGRDASFLMATAVMGVVVGVLMITWGVRRRRSLRWTIALGLASITVAAALAIPVLMVDAYPTTYAQSSVPYSAPSIARGATLYAQHCAVCHGTGGEGDGPAAATLPRSPANLTGAHLADHTSGDMFWWLTNGIRNSPMPAFGLQLSPRDRWDVINFVHALSAGERGRRLTARLEPVPWLVAPDFGFGIGFGATETLKQQRGRAMVLLVLFTLPDSLPRLEQLDRAWTTLGLAGARIIAVPMTDAAQIYRHLGPRVTNFTIAVDGADEATRAYTLFRHTAAPKRSTPDVRHMEFLIDRQGYIRARWLPGQDAGWSDTGHLLAEIARLDKEPAGVPAPEGHVH